MNARNKAYIGLLRNDIIKVSLFADDSYKLSNMASGNSRFENPNSPLPPPTKKIPKIPVS